MEYIITKIYESRAGINLTLTPKDSPEEAEEKLALLLSPAQWYDEKLHEGDAISEEAYLRLSDVSSYNMAVDRAQKMLATSDYSRAKLISRITHYGIDRQYATRAADLMVEKGYINEREQTKKIAVYFCLKKYWGKKRIAAELMGRGYDRKAIFEAIDSITDEQYSYALNRIISQKFKAPPADRRERDNRIAALQRLGFSLSEIFSALPDADGQEEDD